MSTFTQIQTFEVVNCCDCGVSFGMSKDYITRRRNDHAWFYCPTGHKQYYSGKNEVQKLQEQLDQAQLQRDRARMTATEAQHERDAIAKAHRRMRIRVMNGVCPCCNRSFENLRQHMSTQHADFGQPQTMKALREAFGMSQSAVANEAGVRAPYVSLFERGRPMPADARAALTWWLEKQGVAA